MTHELFSETLAEVRSRIADAACQSGRRAEDITLVGVTKYVDPDPLMHWAAQAGLIDFGENHPQSIRDKSLIFPEARWHMIGHLQRNKVRYCVGKTALIQTLDSDRLADAIQHQASLVSCTQDVLIQVNIGREPQKSGVLPEALPQLIDHVLQHCPQIRLRGLMAVPPIDAAEPAFEAMRRLFEAVAASDPIHPMDTLSMGMSHDYEAAILAGSTMVRVGTLLFGARPKK